MYLFEKPLIRGTLLKRKSQFTALIGIDGEELIAHIPTTNRIGDVENKNLPCLLSYHDDPKRKLKYDIEAVLLSDDENWIGINQILSDRLRIMRMQFSCRCISTAWNKTKGNLQNVI